MYYSLIFAELTSTPIPPSLSFLNPLSLNPFKPHQRSALDTFSGTYSTSKTPNWTRSPQFSSECNTAGCSLWRDQGLLLRERLGRVLLSHAQNFESDSSVGCHPRPSRKLNLPHFLHASTPSIPLFQSTYWGKVSLITFRQVWPKILPLVLIFSFIITTYLTKFIGIKYLHTKQCSTVSSIQWI